MNLHVGGLGELHRQTYEKMKASAVACYPNAASDNINNLQAFQLLIVARHLLGVPEPCQRTPLAGSLVSNLVHVDSQN